MSSRHADTAPDAVREVVVVQRPPSWRGTPFSLSYVHLDREVSGAELLGIYRWATGQQLENPRVISPFTMEWSSVFHPRFYRAAAGTGATTVRSLEPVEANGTDSALQRLWFESVVFLASVTLSAAIVQSRFSSGTLASKYDRLWQAGKFASTGLVPGLQGQALMDDVSSMASDSGVSDLERLLAIRRRFEEVIACLRGPESVTEVSLVRREIPAELGPRFGFLEELRHRLGARLECVIVYGSSVNSEHFADYDLVLVAKDPEAVLRKLYATSPRFSGKELNVGVYSSDELWRMQCLSGDNLADYGLCIYGETRVPAKSATDLLMRNLSFGIVRQRQQLGMVGAALADHPLPGDDRRNLYGYFTKIPANIAKGTFGAMNQRLTKEEVHDWIESICGFRTTHMQQLASDGDPGRALAESAVATGAVLRALNERFTVVRPHGATEQGVQPGGST
ncbi:hypothetical protein [Paeniglutamicibacter sp. NPDC091659]|uniref:hypothetical protein n=1 Tax=Paeniglutamicibacter sp. NPDC091659 TaxID=3364389 RepID=UPI00381C5A83